MLSQLGADLVVDSVCVLPERGMALLPRIDISAEAFAWH